MLVLLFMVCNVCIYAQFDRDTVIVQEIGNHKIYSRIESVETMVKRYTQLLSLSKEQQEKIYPICVEMSKSIVHQMEERRKQIQEGTYKPGPLANIDMTGQPGKYYLMISKFLTAEQQKRYNAYIENLKKNFGVRRVIQ